MTKIDWKAYGKICVFIDASNIIFSCKEVGWPIDYKKLQNYFKKNSNLVRIYFYTGILPDEYHKGIAVEEWARRKAGQQNLLGMLRRKGFVIRTRQIKFIKQNDGTYFMKGDCDALLSMDMWRVAHTYDTAVLMSGDSDFADVVKMLRRDLKKSVVVVSTKKHVSRELLQAANQYLNLKKFKKEFAGTGRWANGWYERNA